jgi:ATP-dependent RNA helicase DDX5/DBP2
MAALTEMKKEKKSKGEKKEAVSKKRERSPSAEDTPDELAKAVKRAAKKAKKAAASAATPGDGDDDAPPTPTKNFSVDNLAGLAGKDDKGAEKGATKKGELAAFFAHGDVAKQTAGWLTEHEVTVHDSGSATKICLDFGAAPFDAPLVKLLQQQGFAGPSAVQGAAWPMAADGRDILAIAKTGSGKTLAFLLPALTVCAANMKTSKGAPVTLIMSPTRELALQIAAEAAKFGKPMGCRSVAVYGGAPKWAQASQLQRGVELIVATPGRMMDMLVRLFRLFDSQLLKKQTSAELLCRHRCTAIPRGPRHRTRIVRPAAGTGPPRTLPEARDPVPHTRTPKP